MLLRPELCPGSHREGLGPILRLLVGWGLRETPLSFLTPRPLLAAFGISISSVFAGASTHGTSMLFRSYPPGTNTTALQETFKTFLFNEFL